jgi:hypothetical protein
MSPKLPPPPVRYRNAETRGRLRQWEGQLAALLLHRDFVRRLDDPELQRVAAGFTFKNSLKGRRRAYQKLARALTPTGAVLEAVRLEDPAIVLWSILKPRDGAIIDAPRETGLTQPLRHRRLRTGPPDQGKPKRGRQSSRGCGRLKCPTMRSVVCWSARGWSRGISSGRRTGTL